MGWNVYSLGEIDYIEVMGHFKRIKGKCPMCGQEFDITFDLKNGPTDYACICGYFRFDAEANSLAENANQLSPTEWIKRREDKEDIAKAIKADPVKLGMKFRVDEGFTCDPVIFDPKSLCNKRLYEACRAKCDCLRTGGYFNDFGRCRFVRLTSILEEVQKED